MIVVAVVLLGAAVLRPSEAVRLACAAAALVLLAILVVPAVPVLR